MGSRESVARGWRPPPRPLFAFAERARFARRGRRVDGRRRVSRSQSARAFRRAFRRARALRRARARRALARGVGSGYSRLLLPGWMAERGWLQRRQLAGRGGERGRGRRPPPPPATTRTHPGVPHAVVSAVCGSRISARPDNTTAGPATNEQQQRERTTRTAGAWSNESSVSSSWTRGLVFVDTRSLCRGHAFSWLCGVVRLTAALGCSIRAAGASTPPRGRVGRDKATAPSNDVTRLSPSPLGRARARGQRTPCARGARERRAHT